jgi:hypothetical protein
MASDDGGNDPEADGTHEGIFSPQVETSASSGSNDGFYPEDIDMAETGSGLSDGLYPTDIKSAG